MAWAWSEDGGWIEVPEPSTTRMATIPCSQNGFPANNRSLIATMTAGGVKFPVRKGPCGELLMWAAERWHNEVEPLVPGTCWGYAERDIIGSNVISNHASGTAIDINAPKHPLATNPSANFSAAQIAAIRRIVADAKGALRWGGDYTGRKDGMHLEINAPEAEVAAVLSQVSSGGGAVVAPNMNQQIDEMHEQLLGVLPAWGGGITDDKGTPYNMLQHLLRVSVTTYQSSLMLQKLLSIAQQPGRNQLQQADINKVVAAVHGKLGATVADITHQAVADEISDQMETAGFWKAAAERAVKTFAQTALVLLGAGPLDILSIAWEATLSLSAGAALISVLTSLASAQTGTKGSPSLVKERN